MPTTLENTREYRNGDRQGVKIGQQLIADGCTNVEEATQFAYHNADQPAYVAESNSDEVHSNWGMGLSQGVWDAFRSAGLV